MGTTWRLRYPDLYEYNTTAVTKSTDAHSGSFAAKLTNTQFNTPQGPVVLEGALILGTKLREQITYEGYPIGGAAYTARPTQLQFYYKLTGPATDTAIATFLLTKTGRAGTQPTLVGGGTIFLTPSTTGGYVGVTANIPYNTSDTPDSVRIQFSSGAARVIAAGSTLLVDDVSVIGATLATRADASTQAKLVVAPNPSPAGRIQLSAPTEPTLASAPLTILDLTGRVVLEQPALAVPTPTRELDLSSLRTGIYVLRLDSKEGLLTRQLVVQ